MDLNNKSILITGGTGSFGKRFTEIVLKNYNPKTIMIYDNRELAEVEMDREFNDKRLKFFLGDVRDKKRLYRAMADMDIVVHAAALKHVPICEYNPIEAIKTNITGAINVVDSAIDRGVKKVITISTDKAVQPVNLYGATKMVAERIFVQGNSYTSETKTIFSCVRYGNVVGSSGSIVPLFEKQKEKGEVTITDERMTRFWITLDEGVGFVINCIEVMEGGEIFVPKIPSMKIVDVAEAIAPEAKRKIVGMRPGEKLHETLLTSDEARHTREFDKYFIIDSEFPLWCKNDSKAGKSLPEGFRYASDENSQWLTKDDFRKMTKS